MIGAGGNDILAGGDDEDVIFGGSGFDNLFGGNDDDLLVGQSGIDQLYGGSGDDTLVSGHSGITFAIAGVANAVFDQGGFMDGGTGNDTLVVDVFLDGNLAIDGGGDIDTIDFSQQSNVWQGGVPVGLPTNLLDLESGIGETPIGGSLTVARVENITGSEYRDEFYGNDFANVLKGMSNADVLEGRGGADVLDGGSGYDIAQYTSASSGVEVDMARTTQRLTVIRDGILVSNGDAAGDTLISIEELRGSDFADILRGKSGGGLPSNEAFYGGAGDDILEGRFGADTLDGGAGFDFASYESSSAAVNVSLPRPGYQNAQFGDAAGDTFASIEGLIGSAFADTLVGNDDANELRGGSGADQLSALGGNDTLKGGAGADTLTGGSGRDVLFGESGADTFKYYSTSDSGGSFQQRDMIMDFTRDGWLTTRGSLGDTIDLSAIDADQRSGRSGNQNFDFIGNASFTGAGQLRVTAAVDDSGRTFSLVQAEVTGDNIADFQMTVYSVNDSVLGFSDFLV